MSHNTIVWGFQEPPSVNAMYKNVPGRGRVKTQTYKTWEQLCLYQINQGKGRYVSGEYIVVVYLSENTRKDVDNCNKAVLDMLKKAGITEDDSNCYAVTCTKSPDVEKGQCKVVISERDGRYFPFIAVAERAGAALKLVEVAS